MRLHSHPMNARMNQPTKRRLKRSSFIHQSRILEKQDSELLARPRAPSHPTKYPHSLLEKDEVPSHQGQHPRNRKQKNPGRPGAEFTDRISNPTTLRTIKWTHAYTDGPATAATRDGRGGVYIRYKGEESSILFSTGKYPTNFRDKKKKVASY